MSDTNAVEVRSGDSDAPILITCEHASQRMPDGWSWPDADRRLLDTHWAYDIGAADLSLALAERVRATAVLSTFTRMLIDPNRPEDSPTLFRQEAEGRAVELNRGLSAEAQARRIARFHHRYHATLDREVRASSAPILVAMHSFTPVYEGSPRSLEIGVLFDRDEALGHRVQKELRAAGYRTELQQPYSGKNGLMYSADRHARAHGRKAVELEVRQDLAVDPAFAARLVSVLAAFLMRGNR